MRATKATDHWVHFYDADTDRCEPVVDYVRQGIAAGANLVLVLNHQHQQQLKAQLPGRLLDDWLAGDRLRLADADDVASDICRGGAPDRALFRARVEPLLANFDAPRIYGEAVGWFSRQRRYDDALALEKFWNELREEREFGLLCGYPYQHFPSEDDRALLERLCHAHSPLPGTDQQQTLTAACTGQLRCLLNQERQLRTKSEEVVELLRARLADSESSAIAGLLAKGVAHDLSNLLTVISANADEMVHHANIDEQHQELLEAICVAAERAGALTRALYSLNEQRPPEPQRLSPNDVVRGLHQLVSAGPSRARFELDLTADLGEIQADRVALERALLNLIVNAQHAVGRDGLIRLETRRVPGASPSQPPSVAMVVHDNGPGIPEALRERIFQHRFSTKLEGAGLGLSNAQGLVQASGGELRLESEPGQGSSFSILYRELPLTLH